MVSRAKTTAQQKRESTENDKKKRQAEKDREDVKATVAAMGKKGGEGRRAPAQPSGLAPGAPKAGPPPHNPNRKLYPPKKGINRPGWLAGE